MLLLLVCPACTPLRICRPIARPANLHIASNCGSTRQQPLSATQSQSHSSLFHHCDIAYPIYNHIASPPLLLLLLRLSLSFSLSPPSSILLLPLCFLLPSFCLQAHKPQRRAGSIEQMNSKVIHGLLLAGWLAEYCPVLCSVGIYFLCVLAQRHNRIFIHQTTLDRYIIFTH